jgi:hypothetical protein
MYTEVSSPIARCGMFLALVVALSTNALAARPVPGGIQLLPGYEHKPLQGFDSIVGVIEKQGGLQIHYDIGRITPPGQPEIGGDFRDAAERLGHDKTYGVWYKEQVVNGQPVHIACGKDHTLRVTFPQSGVNFSTKAETVEGVTEALLMLLTYPVAKPTETK